jgi:hypothetical protein
LYKYALVRNKTTAPGQKDDQDELPTDTFYDENYYNAGLGIPFHLH